jgi:hypothetical protein
MPNLDLNEIIQQLDKPSFLASLGLNQNAKGRWQYIPCHFCQAKDKFSIDLTKGGLWKCFKCGENGNLITLYAKLHTCSNGDAVKAIKEFAGIVDDKPQNSNTKGKSSRKVVPIKTKPEKNINDNRENNNVPINSSGQIQTGGDDIPPWADPQDAKEQPGSPDTKHVDSEQLGSGRSEVTATGATAQPRDIYTELVNLAHLTDAHRNELRTKRGFTDDTIDQLMFRSGGQHLIEVIEQLRDRFEDNDLRDAGILVEINGTTAYNDKLVNDTLQDKHGKPYSNILIPYLNDDGQVYHIRPHKSGFKGIPIEIYCRIFLRETLIAGLNWIVLTEGEFKGAALRQLKIPGLATPGIQSFVEAHFDSFVSLLREYGIRKVVMLFDNEIKDNPEFPNYKERPEKRYDTDYYAFMMAYKLNAEGFISRVGKFPDEWRQKGKIDCDGALAVGKSREDFMKVIDQAKTANDFIESLPEDAQRIVKRKKAKYFLSLKSPVKREFNRYMVIRGNGEKTWDEVVSNFVINIKSSFFTPDGVVRNINFVNEFGETSATFPLAASHMAGLHEFKQWAYSKGNYLFKGKSDDLAAIWEYEFARDVGELIYMPDRIGRIENDIWLFANVAIQHGKVYRPDSDGIMWIDGRGYKPQSIQINMRGEATNEAIPSLYEKQIDLADLALKMKKTVGGYEAYMGLGWVIATIFNQDIFKAYRCSPILFPHGKRSSGKTTFGRWINHCFGSELEGAGLADTSPSFIGRSVSYFSSLCCYFEEYRNELRVTQKDGLFRGIYNRQFSGKGTNTSIYTRSHDVYSNVMIVGEELPRDNGLFTRLIPLQFSEHKRNPEYYEYLNKHMNSFSYLAYYVILHYDELKPKILKNIADLKQMLLSRDISDRTAENWAICAGAFDAVILEDAAFIRWVEAACQEIKQTGEKEHMLSQFFNDISVLVHERKLNDSHITSDRTKNTLAIWTGVYSIWSQHYRMVTGHEPFDELSIRKYLMDEPYFIKRDKVTFDEKIRKQAFILKYDQAPEEIQDAAEMITTRKWQEPGMSG